MTGIHHTAPATHLHATRRPTVTTSWAARHPSRLLLAVRRLIDRPPAPRPACRVDATPATAAR